MPISKRSKYWVAQNMGKWSWQQTGFLIRMATWRSVTFLPTPPFSVREKGRRQNGIDGLKTERMSSGPQTKEAPLYVCPSILESEAWQRVVCVLRYEDPGQISSTRFLETSPQDRNTATKLVTNTAIQLLSIREKERENSSLYHQEVQRFHVRCPNQSSCGFLNKFPFGDYFSC